MILSCKYKYMDECAIVRNGGVEGIRLFEGGCEIFLSVDLCEQVGSRNV